MSRQTRNGVPVIEPDVWHVSYCSKIGLKHGSERGIARGTQRFKSEVEAKQFAQEIIRNGWSAIAGTINPYKPKRAISSRQILEWIGQKEVITGPLLPFKGASRRQACSLAASAWQELAVVRSINIQGRRAKSG